MILDSSAIVAMILHEPGAEQLERQLDVPVTVGVGAATLVEVGLVLAWRTGQDARRLIAGFLGRTGTEVIPFTERHYEVAIEAFQRYGKGRHPARLNFGDCLSYAVARVAHVPLLYIGDDFSKTDL